MMVIDHSVASLYCVTHTFGNGNFQCRLAAQRGVFVLFTSEFYWFSILGQELTSPHGVLSCTGICLAHRKYASSEGCSDKFSIQICLLKSDSDPVLRNLEHCDGSSTIFPQIVHLSLNNTNVILKRWNKQVFPVWIFFSELWSVHSCLKRNEKWCHLACLNRVIFVKTRKSYAQTG